MTALQRLRRGGIPTLRFLALGALTLGVLFASPNAGLAPRDGTALAASTGDVQVTLDGSRTYQTIDGFGVNANARSWNNGQLAPGLDMLIDGMGARIFRVILEKSDWQSGPLTGTTPTDLYESPKFQNLWGTIGYLNARHAPIVMLSLMGTIPAWMGGGTLSVDQEDQWVQMVASVVDYGRTVRHVQFNLLSPMNEEDNGAPEGPRVGPEQYARIMGKLAVRLSALGLGDVRLVGPEAASAGAGALDYAPQMLANPGLMSQVAHMSVHLYSGDTGMMGSTLRQSAYSDRDFWVTEWSAWCQGCDNGYPVEAEWSFASTTTDLLLGHLEHGASGALVYDGYDSYYEHHAAFSYWGQLAFDATTGTYSPRKRFYTNAQVFRFVAPGMVRLGSSTSDQAVSALAFRDPGSGQLTIVGHNSRTTDTTLRLALQGVEEPGSSLRLYQTTWTADVARGPDVRILDGGEANATIAADSFFTLTTTADASLQPAADPPPTPGAGSSQPAAAPPPPAVTANHEPTVADSGVLVGEGSVQMTVDTDAAGTAEAFQYTARASGSATRVNIYLGPGSTATQVAVGLYTDANGAPGTLLASGTIGDPHGAAWNRVEIPAVTVQAGVAYWIAALAPASDGRVELLDAGDSAGKSVTSADTALNALPAGWLSGAAWASSPMSAYLN